MASGGAYSSLISLTRNRYQASLNKVLRKGQISVANPVDAVLTLLAAPEEATKVGYFKKLPETLSDVEKATASRNINVDFARKGLAMQELSAITPFYNPMLQGKRRIVSALKDKRFWYAVGAYVTGITILDLLQRGNKTYDQVPDEEKDRWTILVPEALGFCSSTQVIRLPKPYEEIGFVLGGLPKAIFDQYFNKHPEALTRWAKEVVAYNVGDMLPMPQALETLIGLKANTRFGGAPIIPPSRLKLLPELQDAPTTGSAAILAGETLRLSPAQLEYLVKSSGGYWGQTMLSVADAIVDKLEIPGLPNAPAQDAASYWVNTVVRQDPAGFRSDAVRKIMDLYREVKPARLSQTVYADSGRIEQAFAI